MRTVSFDRFRHKLPAKGASLQYSQMQRWRWPTVRRTILFDLLLRRCAYLSCSNSTPNLVKDRDCLLHLCCQEQNRTIASLVGERNQTVLFYNPNVMLDCLVIHAKSLC